MYAIEIKDLVKKFGDFTAVDNIDLKIEEGSIYGLLGPNGAGKSTTISLICGLLNKTSGDIKIFGKELRKNIDEIKKNLGLVPQSMALYDNFTAYENVKFFAQLYGLRGAKLEEGINKALRLTGLLEVKNKKPKEFSGGMNRRLNIACSIAHSPKLIIMDEPTVGIDPQSRNNILESVKELNKKGATIIYTTHYMEEAEALCERIAIIDHGKVIVEGTKDELKDTVSNKNNLSVVIDDVNKINSKEIKNINGVENIKIENNSIEISSDKDVNNLDKIISYFSQKNARISDIGYKDITLETVFLSLTGRGLRD
ncbi:MAG: ABC transporter ATP-binding protein [Clostridiaceae bacterium]|nr:ABC transporter ATP-binding protein [Clostridiaceae bacterium]